MNHLAHTLPGFSWFRNVGARPKRKRLQNDPTSVVARLDVVAGLRLQRLAAEKRNVTQL